jgi:hypothetical protein
MKGKEPAFESRFMEQLLDISGAAGHMDWTCAKKLIEPIFEAYHNVYDVAKSIISGGLGLRDGYDLILVRRCNMLNKRGFRALNVKDPQDRALMRLLCMGGVASLDTAQLYDAAWRSLDRSTKDSLIHSLNIDGSITEPAVQPTYMPALLVEGVNASGPRTRDEKEKTLQSILHYLARVMTVKEKPNGSTSIIKRSVLSLVQDVVGDPAFLADPDILQKMDVPPSAVAKSG